MNAPDFIDHLKPGQYIVVGTNYQGHHGSGAALYAMDHFGLIWGCGSGLSGQTYAISTMEGSAYLAANIEIFKEFARFNPDKTFLMTRVGCGIAGYTDEQIAPLFKDTPTNVWLPKEWSLI